jgi:hypothetical protein
MLLEYALELLRNFTDCLVPGYSFESVSHLLQRVEQPVGIVLVKSDVHALPTNISFAYGAILVRADFDNSVVLNLDFHTATIAAQYTTRLLP